MQSSSSSSSYHICPSTGCALRQTEPRIRKQTTAPTVMLLHTQYSPVRIPQIPIATLPCSLTPSILPLPSVNPLNRRSLRLLTPILTPRRNPSHHPTQIPHPPNKMIPHTRTILTPSPPNHNNTMLLHIMANPRYIRAYHPST